VPSSSTGSSIRLDDLAAHVLRELTSRNPDAHWDKEGDVDDVVLGCANQAGEDNRNVARMALLLAGLPQSVSGTTVNRLCGSGADAVAIASWAIQAGQAHLVIVGGVESMSREPFVMPKAETGQTAENVATERGISRKDQDVFTLRSQQRTAKALAVLRDHAQTRRPPSGRHHVHRCRTGDRDAARAGHLSVIDNPKHQRMTTVLERRPS
jgi:acetyl-CoA acetyltransferase